MKNDLPISLARATEQMYRVFGRYELPPRVLGCSHCVSQADELRLGSAPLRNLQHEDLAKFAFKAMTTWGTVDDFRHFLPRIFELISLEGAAWIDTEVAVGKLKYGNWSSWPADEQSAVRSFLQAMWLDVLGRFPQPFEADSCLCSIGQAEDDLSWYLATWDVAGSGPAARHFVDFVCENAPRGRTSLRHPWKLQNAFWSERPEQAHQVIVWVLASERAKELERAFFTFGSQGAEISRHLSDGVDRLSWIRHAAQTS